MLAQLKLRPIFRIQVLVVWINVLSYFHRLFEEAHFLHSNRSAQISECVLMKNRNSNLPYLAAMVNSMKSQNKYSIFKNSLLFLWTSCIYYNSHLWWVGSLNRLRDPIHDTSYYMLKVILKIITLFSLLQQKALLTHSSWEERTVGFLNHG